VSWVWGRVEAKAPNKANGADGRFKAFIAGFVLNCVLVAAAHWRALGAGWFFKVSVCLFHFFTKVGFPVVVSAVAVVKVSPVKWVA
jgi:heme/copper-type cytochrome/quinol oxidase subunit 4